MEKAGAAAIAHSTVLDVVSLPATNRSYIMIYEVIKNHTIKQSDIKFVEFVDKTRPKT